MGVFREVREGIRENAESILSHFYELTEEEPWVKLPRDFRVDALPELTVAVADLALGRTQGEALCRRVLEVGVSHGEHRLKRGFPESLLFHEHYLLRKAIWRYIREHHQRDAKLIGEAIVRIDSALSLAVRASLRGFHRPAFEHLGRWDAAIDDLRNEWQELPPVE